MGYLCDQTNLPTINIVAMGVFAFLLIATFVRAKKEGRSAWRWLLICIYVILLGLALGYYLLGPIAMPAVCP